MRSSPHTWALVAIGMLGCPADPTFVASDVTDASATETSEIVGDVETVELVDDETIEVTQDTIDVAQDTIDVAQDTIDVAQDTSEVVDETRACPPACGPLAACVDGACRCADGLCDGAITSEPIDEVSLVMRAVDHPIVVYARFIELPDIAVSRWTGEAWSHEPSFERDYGLPLDATLDEAGRLVVLAATEAGDAAFFWNTTPDSWRDTTTFQSICQHAEIDFDVTSVVAAIGCTNPTTATFLLTHLDIAGDTSNHSPLSLGASPNVNRVRFVYDPIGRPWVAFSTPSTGGAALRVAHYDAGDWQDEPLESVKLPIGATTGPPLAVTVDGFGKPHVVDVHLREGDLVLTHRVRLGADLWSSSDVAFDGALDGLQIIDLEPGTDGTVHLLLVRQSRLVWLLLSDSEVLGGRSLTTTKDVIDADLATDADGAPWVAYAPGRSGLRLWRPAGP